MKTKNIILLITLAVLLVFVGCDKKPKPDALKIKVSDTYFGLVYNDGKPYISLEDFGAYLNPSKHRFKLDVNEDKNTIKLKNDFIVDNKVLYLPEKFTENTEEPIKQEPKNYVIRFNKTKDEYPVIKQKDKFFISLDDAKKLFGFEVQEEEIKVDDKIQEIYYNVKFNDEDQKEQYKANNRDYDWYLDQAHTGEYCDGNCGPTSVAMVMKWLDQNTDITGESARNEDPNGGDWWSTVIIENYFERHGVNVESKIYTAPETITDMIDDGRIILVCIVMSEIEANKDPDSSNIGRFYGFDGGHFLIIKGYKVVDGVLYYEVYDPNNWDQTYSENGEPMGKDRLYPAHQMDQALRNWWMTIYGIAE